MSKDKHWYGDGITSPWPMTAEKFADRLRKMRGRKTYSTVRVASATRVTAQRDNASIEFTGKDY